MSTLETDGNITGQWAIVQPELPPAVTKAVESLNSLVGSLISLLQVLQSILDIARTFLVGLINPLTAIIEALIAEIEGLLNDLRQIGVYVSGDFNLEYPYDNILGGFQAYERRMISRLVDTSDPTRPDFSSRSGVLAVFLYAMGDISTLQALKDAISRFFNLNLRDKALPIPTGLNLTYGVTGMGLGILGTLADVAKAGATPNYASLRWKLSPASNANSIAWPLPAPAGFLIEVSTVKDGFLLAYENIPDSATTDSEGQQSRISGLVLDPLGAEFRLYGGKDLLDVGDLACSVSGNTYTFSCVDSSGKLKGGASRVMLFKSAADPVPTPVDALKTPDGKYVFQRTFFLDATVLGVNALGPGQPFLFTLNQEDMPYNAAVEDAGSGSVTVTLDDVPASTVYVRVRAVSTSVQEQADSEHPFTFYYITDSALLTPVGGQVRLGIPYDSHVGDFGTPSTPLEIVFPGASQSDYQKTVATALAITLLSRSDLTPITLEQQEALETATAELQCELARQDPEAIQAAVNESGSTYEAIASLQAGLVLSAQSQYYTVRRSLRGSPANMATSLENVAQSVLPLMMGSRDVNKYFGRVGVDPRDFRRNVLQRCWAVVNHLGTIQKALPDSVMSAILDASSVTLGGRTKRLMEVTWADLDPNSGIDETILDSLAPSGAGLDQSEGVALNPLSIGIKPEVSQAIIGTDFIEREPGFFGTASGRPFIGTGSADLSPVIYRQYSGFYSMAFVRNALLKNVDVLLATGTVLQVAAATMTRKDGDGSWYAYRLFPQGLPPMEAALSNIERFLRSLSIGNLGVVDLIVAYIDFLEARLLELEALLRRIEALLNMILSIQLPAAAGLVIATNGTDGVLQELISAENKPSDSSSSYGLGVVMMAGGIPSVLLDILRLMFPAEGD